MDFMQKSEALAALCELSIKFREKEWRIGGPEPWYVQQRVEVIGGRICTCRYGNGFTPQEAIEDHWRRITDLEDGEYLSARKDGVNPQLVRWNGFMWEHIRKEEVAA